MPKARLIKMSNLTDKQLYRNILRQAKLFSLVFQDPFLFISHSYIARLNLTYLENPVTDRDLQASSIFNRQNKERGRKKHLSQQDKELQSLGFQTSIDLREKRRRIRIEQHLKSLSSANLGYSHCVDRCISQAYGRRGRIRHELLTVSLLKRLKSTRSPCSFCESALILYISLVSIFLLTAF